MQKQRAIEIVQSCAVEARRLGATALYMFGSTARDQASEQSDVDMFVDYDPETFRFVELIRLQEILSQALGGSADLTTRGGLHPALKGEIEREAIRVF